MIAKAHERKYVNLLRTMENLSMTNLRNLHKGQRLGRQLNSLFLTIIYGLAYAYHRDGVDICALQYVANNGEPKVLT